MAVERERQGGATAAAAGSSRTSAPADGAPLTPGSFITSGLSDQKLFASVYLGDFENITFDREDLKFLTLYGQYLQIYAQKCERFLPANKVEMTRQECETERVTRNGYGTELNRVCISYRTVGTGLYADPEMYSAMNKIDALAAGDAFRTVAKMMSQPNPLGSALGMVNDAQVAKNDMASLLETNGCATPGTRRFQENLRRFALNQQPLRIGGKPASTSVVDPLPGIPFKDQNYTRLLDDLITDNSHSWALNRYVQGSVTGAGVMSRDDRGRPTKIGPGICTTGRLPEESHQPSSTACRSASTSTTCRGRAGRQTGGSRRSMRKEPTSSRRAIPPPAPIRILL